ncbi:MAG: calcium/sodium antiporter [Candidatus Competibacteraceae bacterium]|nr:calcium/sodium antiporter [Candidatus Competibacteraceae bacterium]
MMIAFHLLAGFVLLVLGAEWLVRSASRLAQAAGISPLVVGLTVVAFGTSAPELAVSVQSALSGSADIALGNVVGSNIFNVLFILGLSALISPLVVSLSLIRRDVPLMVGVSVLLYLLALNGIIGRLEGALLFAGIVAYTLYAVIEGRRESPGAESQNGNQNGEAQGPTGMAFVLRNLVLLVLGLGLLVIGAGWLVEGAVAVARLLGLSELVIGLTLVAGGTSLPEVAASVIAALRGQRDIAVGNVVGSNLFNILGVLGITALIAPQGVPVSLPALSFDIPVMIAVAVACLPIFFTGQRIDRWEGLLFLFYYVAYTAYLILLSTEHETLPLFSGIMALFVLPLTLLTLVVLAWRARQAR